MRALAGDARRTNMDLAMSCQKEKLQHLEWVEIAVIILSITVVLWMMSAAF